MHYTPAQTRWFLSAVDGLAAEDLVRSAALQCRPEALLRALGDGPGKTPHTRKG